MILFLLNSCSIEKRTFNRGYYISFHSNKISSKKIANEDKINANEKIDTEQEVFVFDSLENQKDLASIESLNGSNYFEISTLKQNKVIYPSLANKKSSFRAKKKHFFKEVSSKNKDDEKFKRRGPVRVTNSLLLDVVIQFFVVLAAVFSGVILSVLSFLIFLFLNSEYLPENNKEEFRKNPKTIKSVFLRAFNISFRIFFTLLSYCLLALILAYLFVTYGWLIFTISLIVFALIILWLFSSKSSKRGMSFLFFGWGK